MKNFAISFIPAISLALVIVLMAGCLRDRASQRSFTLPRIDRELNFYVAIHPLHTTNHFYVYQTDFRRGEPRRATVYWKEERTLLSYAELEADATHDIFAWAGHDVKLDRDTVDTPDEIGGSNYLETHREWVDSVERCITKGKEFTFTKANAEHLFQNQQVQQK